MGVTSGDGERRYRQAIAHAVLRSVVHDLNNPLGTITMAAAALRSTGDDTERGELIDLIEREAMRAGATASSAAEQLAVPLASEPTTLHRVAEVVRDACRSLGVGATFTASTDAGLLVDPILLPQALVAFVADAHDAPDRDGPVEVECGVDGEVLEVSIRDDGEPVPAELARRPFRPLAPTDGRQGRAVGLAVAAGRTHVRRLGGRVELLPGADRGNTVRLRLPVVTSPPAPASATSSTSAGNGQPQARRRRALVVDDDQTMRDMLEVVLRREGWQTAAAPDGPAATALVSEQSVDLVLLDLHVGAEHGPDIAAQLERRRPGTSRRVVYLSGDVPPSGRIDDRPAIAKPFVLEELYRVADAVASAEGPL